tara:strand:- start:118 stop:387 length:270 start_codon:yes stop_codon:yes gene_type:complete
MASGLPPAFFAFLVVVIQLDSTIAFFDATLSGTKFKFNSPELVGCSPLFGFATNLTTSLTHLEWRIKCNISWTFFLSALAQQLSHSQSH